ncbi:hypothetical protein [Streptomyces heilongjiangensis]|uniref:Uncharacterized protein n=1 Tax=Streptomyces heilongjiangensis TaxID=945052 RepID=A0ABW1BD20_9ACTN|nr:hypothetical protein [Streptomyces heilongjiangensis]MDC2952669.1 hypothetical protein [Streptomyces heilongjiangensis]
MSSELSRIVGIATVLGGIALAFWLVFGPPQDWEGGTRWLRHGLALGSLGAISVGARLFFPPGKEDVLDTAPD